MRKVSTAQSSKNGKGKQVEFGQVDIVDGDDSDLTDLTELDEQTQTLPSPRRLRNKGDKTQRKSGIDSSRKASFAQKLKARASEPAHQDEDEDLPDASDEDEDEPMSATSKAGPSRSTARGRRTPVKSRLRPRPTQTHTPPSDGDDEEEEEEETVGEDGEEGDAEDDRADLSDDTEATPIKPRTLRNGKVVSANQEFVEMEEVEDEEIYVDEDETINDETASVQSESTSEVEGEEDSDMEDEASEESMDECEHCLLYSEGEGQTDPDPVQLSRPEYRYSQVSNSPPTRRSRQALRGPGLGHIWEESPTGSSIDQVARSPHPRIHVSFIDGHSQATDPV